MEHAAATPRNTARLTGSPERVSDWNHRVSHRPRTSREIIKGLAEHEQRENRQLPSLKGDVSSDGEGYDLKRDDSSRSVSVNHRSPHSQSPVGLPWQDIQPKLLSREPNLADPGSRDSKQGVALPHCVQHPTHHQQHDTPESVVGGLCRGNKKARQKTQILENHKEDIRKLYVDQNMRLRDVIQVMEKRGIEATEKVYKSKISQWKMFKNNRKADVAAILKHQNHRSAQGKEAVYTRNGKTVDVQRYIKRKRTDVNKLVDLAATGELPAHLRCVTPPPLQTLVRSPGDFGSKELIGHWFLLESRKQEDQPVYQIYGRYCRTRAYTAIETYRDGLWLLSRGYSQKGWKRVSRAFDQFPLILGKWSHFSVFALLVTNIMLPNAGLDKTLWSFLASFSRIQVGQDSVTNRVFEAIMKLFTEQDDDDYRIDFMLSCLMGITDAHGEQSQYHDTMHLWVRNHLALGRQKRGYVYYTHLDRSNVATIPKSLPREGTDHAWDLDYFNHFLLFDAGWKSDWRSNEMVQPAFELLKKARSSRGAGETSGHVEWHCLYAIARHHRAQCAEGEAAASSHRHGLARHYLQLAVELDGRLWPPTKDYFETLLLLEGWCLEAGDAIVLEVVRRKKGECLRNLFVQWDVE